MLCFNISGRGNANKVSGEAGEEDVAIGELALINSAIQILKEIMSPGSCSFFVKTGKSVINYSLSCTKCSYHTKRKTPSEF